MHSQGLKKTLPITPEVLCGKYSKKEAAQFISTGSRHLHSTQLGKNDPLAKQTLDAILKKQIPLYVWEKLKERQTVCVSSSEGRGDKINEVITGMGLKRGFRDKTQMILEELLSNSIFHSYQNPDGSPRYGRRQDVVLEEKEKIKVSFYQSREGIFLSVLDQGGTLEFESVGKAFLRCYGNTSDQIENKEAGAGLGIYMIFENVTHIKIESVPDVRTCFSVWVSEKQNYEPDIFSFNFFRGAENG